MADMASSATVEASRLLAREAEAANLDVSPVEIDGTHTIEDTNRELLAMAEERELLIRVVADARIVQRDLPVGVNDALWSLSDSYREASAAATSSEDQNRLARMGFIALALYDNGHNLGWMTPMLGHLLTKAAIRAAVAHAPKDLAVAAAMGEYVSLVDSEIARQYRADNRRDLRDRLTRVAYRGHTARQSRSRRRRSVRVGARAARGADAGLAARPSAALLIGGAA